MISFCPWLWLWYVTSNESSSLSSTYPFFHSLESHFHTSTYIPAINSSSSINLLFLQLSCSSVLLICSSLPSSFTRRLHTLNLTPATTSPQLSTTTVHKSLMLPLRHDKVDSGWTPPSNSLYIPGKRHGCRVWLWAAALMTCTQNNSAPHHSMPDTPRTLH